MRHFDTIVVGNEIAGLVAGALLAKGGQRVLHLAEASAPAPYRYRDLTFPRRLRLLSTWDASPAQKRVLFDLNLITEVSRRLRPLDPSFQLVEPSHRLDVSTTQQTLLKELDREFPGSGPSTSTALEKLEEVNERLDAILDGHLLLKPEKWKEKRELQRALSENPLPKEAEVFGGVAAGHPMLRISRLAARFISYCDPTAEHLVRWARAGRYVRTGLCEIEGGLATLRELLSGVIQHYHGEGRQQPIEEVNLKWGRIASFRLDNGEVVGCEQVIAAQPAEVFYGLLPPKQQRKALQALGEDLRPTHSVYLLNLSIHRDGIPEAMGPLGLWQRDPEGPGDGENVLLWRLGKSKSDLRALTIACWLPESETRSEGYWDELPKRLIADLDHLLPFFGDYLVDVDAPQSGEGLERVFRWDGQSSLGLTALPQRTPLKNVVLANRQNLPVLGLEGEYLAGTAAARMLRSKKTNRDLWGRS